MMDIYVYINTFCLLAVAFLLSNQERTHRKEVNRLHDNYLDERAQLLDRIMANNIQEFKSARTETEVKRSETGNFLKDRMEKQAKQYVDTE